MHDLKAIEYEVDGRSFCGYLADGSGGRRAPGVLVAHEGAGLTAHPKQRAQMLAERGYVAFAMDIFGERDPTLDEAKAIVRSLRADLPMLRRRAKAALDLIAALPEVDTDRLAAIGFCFGGKTVLELARSGANVVGTVGFHAELTTSSPEGAGAIRGKVLVCQGADDPVIGGDQREAFAAEMTAAKVDWQMLVFGGVGHSFTNRDIDAWNFPGFAYDADADRRSWFAMCHFLDEVLGRSVEGASG